MPLITYTAPRKASEYDGLIDSELKALIEATDAYNADPDANPNERPAIGLEIPTIDANKFYVAFGAAAREAGKTAVFKVRESDGKVDPKKVYEEGRLKGQPLPTGNTKFVILLTDPRKPSRGSKDSQPTLDSVEAETE